MLPLSTIFILELSRQCCIFSFSI